MRAQFYVSGINRDALSEVPKYCCPFWFWLGDEPRTLPSSVRFGGRREIGARRTAELHFDCAGAPVNAINQLEIDDSDARLDRSRLFWESNCSSLPQGFSLYWIILTRGNSARAAHSF